jgi:hypothetical protein
MPPKRKPKEVASGMINFYDKLPKELLPKVENPNERLHKMTIPFRCCVVGPSGSGKTSWLMNLIHLFSQGKGTFASICVVTANSDEPLYKFLQKQDDQIRVVEGIQNTPKLDKFDKSENHLVIWDDLVLSKHLDVVCNYYIRARKQSVSCVFISQSYYHIPLIIRKNCNYLVLLKLQGMREINSILRETGIGLTKEQLVAMYEYATDTKMSPLIVDFNEEPDKRFRKGFLEIINANNFLQAVGPRPKPHHPAYAHQYHQDYSSSDED